MAFFFSAAIADTAVFIVAVVAAVAVDDGCGYGAVAAATTVAVILESWFHFVKS